jgi:hypothetical protein
LRARVGQIAPVAFQRLVARLGALVGHPLGTADLAQRLQQPVAGDAVALERVHARSLAFGEGEQQMLAGHILILERLGFPERSLEDAVQLG